MVGSSSADSNSSLPSSLEEDKLETLLVDHEGSYGDNHVIFAVVSTMTIGQRVLILEEKEDKDRERYREEGRKEGNT